MKLIRTTTVCFLAVALVSCAELIGPQYALRPGALQLDGLGPVQMLDTVSVSTTFDILVRTTGGGCGKFGTTEVKIVDDFTVEIRPYDYVQTNASRCNLIERLFQHHETIQLSRAGVATVRVIGENPESTGTVTKTVVVR